MMGGTSRDVASFKFRWLEAVNAAIAAGTRIHRADRPDDPGERMTGLDLQVVVACMRWINDPALIFFRSHKDLAADCGATENGIKKAVDRLIAGGFLAKASASAALKGRRSTGRPAQSYQAQIPETFPNRRDGKTAPSFPNRRDGKPREFPQQSGGKVAKALSPTTVRGLSPTTVGANYLDNIMEGADAPSGARRPAPYRPCPIIDEDNPFNDDPEPLPWDDDDE